MTLTTVVKDERINIRLKQSSKKLLERAAAFEGKTVSSFILHSALEQAEKSIQYYESMQLNAHDSEAFFNALSQPVQFNNDLSAAIKELELRVIQK